MFAGTISDTSVLNYVKTICANRFMRFNDPCEGCVYRNREYKKGDAQTCLFDNCPRDWNVNRHV